MSLEEIMKAEQTSDAAKVELEARIATLSKELTHANSRANNLAEHLADSESKRAQQEGAHKRLKEQHKDEVTRLLCRIQSSSLGRESPSMNQDGKEAGERDTIRDNVVTLKYSLDQLKEEIQTRENNYQELLKESESKILGLKSQLSELVEKGSLVQGENEKHLRSVTRYEETIELMNAEASTWREKLRVLETEKNMAIEEELKALHALEMKNNEILRLESKFSTEMAKVAEEIERSFDEAEKALSEKKAMQEELETLQTSTSYLNNTLEEKAKEITDLQAKISALEQLLLKFEGVTESEKGPAAENVKQLNLRLEDQSALYQRTQQELLLARQQLIISENSACQFRQTIHDLMAEKQKLGHRLAEAEAELNDRDNELDELSADYKQLSEEHANLRESHEQLIAKTAQAQQEVENIQTTKKIQELERLSTQRVSEIMQLNEKIHIASVKNATLEQEYQTLKQSSSRESHEMQSKIRSLKEQNNLLIDIKKEKENEISKLTAETNMEISLLKEQIEDLNLMCESLEQVQAMQGDARAELGEQMKQLRKSLQERKDAKGDPVAMAQEIKQLKADLNKRAFHNKKLIECNNKLVNQFTEEISRMKRRMNENLKHLGVSQETLKAKQIEINRHKEEIRLVNDEKLDMLEEIRHLRNQLQMAVHHHNHLKDSYGLSLEEIQELRNALAEQERRVSDLASGHPHAKEGLLAQYKKSLDDSKKQISQLEKEVTFKENSMHVLKERLADLSKKFNIPVDTSLLNEKLDRDHLYKCLCDILNALKLLRDFGNDDLRIERSPEEVKHLTSKMVETIRDLSVESCNPAKRSYDHQKGGKSGSLLTKNHLLRNTIQPSEVRSTSSTGHYTNL
jgi:chromosome segregation ATPase